jgi:hypothetical protein
VGGLAALKKKHDETARLSVFMALLSMVDAQEAADEAAGGVSCWTPAVLTC